MARILFLNMPAHGHINPTLAIVKELTTRGHKVDYCCTPNFAEALSDAGAEAILYQPPEWLNSRKGHNPATDLPLRLLDDGNAAIRQVKNKLTRCRYDLVIYDVMCLWGRLFAQGTKTRAASFRPTYAANEKFAVSKPEEAKKLMATWDSTEIKEQMALLAAACFDTEPIDIKTMWTHSENLNIVAIPKEIQPMVESFDDSYVFTGMCHYPRDMNESFDVSRFRNKTTLFFSLGTVFNAWPEFFSMCIEAFRDVSGIEVVIAAGQRVDIGTLGTLPANFTVASHLPQLQIFPHTSLCVFHGGMNTTLEALSHKVPLVVIPQMMEQAMTARRVEEMSLGMRLEKQDVSSTVLKNTVFSILENSQIKNKVTEFSTVLNSQNGGSTAADAIERYLR